MDKVQTVNAFCVKGHYFVFGGNAKGPRLWVNTTLEHRSILCAWSPLNLCWCMSHVSQNIKVQNSKTFKYFIEVHFLSLKLQDFLCFCARPRARSFIMWFSALSVLQYCHCGWRLGDPPQSHTLGPVFSVNIAMESLNTDLHSPFSL